jgi:hypothetical protein
MMNKLKYFYEKFLSFIGFKYKLEFSEDVLLRHEMKKMSIYAIGGLENCWCITFICPCGCNEIILLNSLDNFPSWRIKSEVPVTIKPSIHRIKGCKSHFWIINGKARFVTV